MLAFGGPVDASGRMASSFAHAGRFSDDVIRQEAVRQVKRAPLDQPLLAWVAPGAPHVCEAEGEQCYEPEVMARDDGARGLRCAAARSTALLHHPDEPAARRARCHPGRVAGVCVGCASRCSSWTAWCGQLSRCPGRTRAPGPVPLPVGQRHVMGPERLLAEAHATRHARALLRGRAGHRDRAPATPSSPRSTSRRPSPSWPGQSCPGRTARASCPCSRVSQMAEPRELLEVMPRSNELSYQGWSAIRTPERRLIRWEDGQRELYDLAADPGSARTSWPPSPRRRRHWRPASMRSSPEMRRPWSPTRRSGGPATGPPTRRQAPQIRRQAPPGRVGSSWPS